MLCLSNNGAQFITPQNTDIAKKKKKNNMSK